MSNKKLYRDRNLAKSLWACAAIGAYALFVGCIPATGNASAPDVGPTGTSPSDKTLPPPPKSLTTTSKMSKLNLKFNELTEKEADVLIRKGTEPAWIGELTDNKRKGTYICRRCNSPLYKSDSKFDSHCGWPSFDDEIKGAVDRHPDADGRRTEIVCHHCEGHLGHVFLNEGLTAKNTRHCVNSISMRFVEEGKDLPPVVKPDALDAKDSKDASDLKKPKGE